MEIPPIRKNIPQGKFRVIGLDLFSGEDCIVKDCNTKDEAFKLADDHNRQRTESIDTVYYVYDDQGEYLRGEEAVEGTKGKTSSPN